MATDDRPKVFCIGLPLSGGENIAALFKANGYAWAHHKGGALIKDIAFAQTTGTAPLARWENITCFSGLYSLRKRHLPLLMVGDHLSYLLAQFPDAYFVHTHRDPADWIAARFWSDDDEHRHSAAWHAGVTEHALPALWRDELTRHRTTCAEVFARHERFFDFNTTVQSTDKIRNFLKPSFDLPKSIITSNPHVPIASIADVMTFLGDRPTSTPQPQADIQFVTQVVDFCIEKHGHDGPSKNLSSTAITWTIDHKVTDRTGAIIPMARNENGDYLLHPDADGLERGQGTLNELRNHGATPPLQIDMMDARFLGAAGRRHAPRKTVAYNRRQDATNLTLWPLPGYHTLAPRGSVGGFPVDQIPFENKKDRCVWLGNMTGRMSPALTPECRPMRGVYNIRDQMQTDNPDWASIIADLMCVPRYRVVKTLRDTVDFNVGLVLRGPWKKLSETPALKGLCISKKPRAWFHKYRYILNLAGNDTGSNFLPTASSNALILKEEDGWELFYTDAFKPWVHYVPLNEGAQDAEEKLAWARANPAKAKAMSDAATQLYDKFANPNNRRAILERIAEHLNTSD